MRAGSGDPRRPGSAGFTLIEMIVTLAIFATVMTVVFATLIFQQRSFAVQSDRMEMRKNLRHAIDVLEKELKNAGSGLPLRPPVRIPAGLVGGSRVSLVSGLGVIDDESGGPDVLVVAHALSPPVRPARGVETASSALAVDRGIRLTAYAVAVPGDHGLPALVRREIDHDGNLRVRTVAEGIEDLQVRLMMPDGSERDAERFGSDPVARSLAVGVRIRLVARGRLAGESRPLRMEAVVGTRNRGSAL